MEKASAQFSPEAAEFFKTRRYKKATFNICRAPMDNFSCGVCVKKKRNKKKEKRNSYAASPSGTIRATYFDRSRERERER